MNAPTPDVADEPRNSSSELLRSLFKELFQAEQSATKHPPIEAERLGSDTPPARAMLAAAAHGQCALADLPVLAASRGLSESLGGVAAGSFFSLGRDAMADLVLSSAQSYRATMVGLHHCFDLVTLLRDLAVELNDDPLRGWCENWLQERGAILREISAQLAWFARNPERAVQPAKPGVAGTAARAVLQVVDKVEGAISRAARPSA